MGNLQVDLGLVQYDGDSLLSPVPLAAQIGLAAGAAVIILSVLVVILMYRYGHGPPVRARGRGRNRHRPDPRACFLLRVLSGGRANRR